MVESLKRLAQAGAAALMLSGAAEAQEATNISFEALDKAVVAQISENYRACILDEADVADDNGNGKVDAGEEAEFFAEGEEHCAEIANLEMITAQLEARIEVAEANIAATTRSLMEDILKSEGL